MHKSQCTVGNRCRADISPGFNWSTGVSTSVQVQQKQALGLQYFSVLQEGMVFMLLRIQQNSCHSHQPQKILFQKVTLVCNLSCLKHFPRKLHFSIGKGKNKWRTNTTKPIAKFTSCGLSDIFMHSSGILSMQFKNKLSNHITWLKDNTSKHLKADNQILNQFK